MDRGELLGLKKKKKSDAIAFYLNEMLIIPQSGLSSPSCTEVYLSGMWWGDVRGSGSMQLCRLLGTEMGDACTGRCFTPKFRS